MSAIPAEARRDLNADAETLAWARAKVERVRDKYLAFAERARHTGKVETAEQCRRFANLLDMELIGGKGCVIAAFDERRPAFAALEAPAPTTEETNQ